MTVPEKATSRKSFWLRLAGTILTLVLLVYLIKEQGWTEIQAALTQISIWQLLAAFVITMISRTAVCARWHALLRGARLEIPFSKTVRITFAGLFASNFLPTTIGGDVIRLAGAIQLRFDSAVATASLVVDRLIGMAGMAMVLPFALPAFQSALNQTFQGNPAVPVPFAASTPIARRAEVSWQKWRNLSSGFFSRIFQAFTHWIRRPRALIQALAFTWVHMLCVYLSIEILLIGMEEPMPFYLIAGLWSAVYFITLLPVSINGYGLQEVSLAFIFTRLGGLTPATALTLGILLRTLSIVASLPGALFVPGIMAARSETSSSPISTLDTSAADQNPIANGASSTHLTPPADE